MPPSAEHLEALRRLSARIAHDVGNYAYAVGGAAEALGRLFDRDPQASSFIEAIRHNSAETGELVEALLAFSGCLQLRPARLDLVALRADLAARLRQTLGESIVVEITLDPDCWPVYADRDALEAAVMELAANARDAMPGGGRLTLRAANAGEDVAITVSDTGSGMPAEVKARAVEPFFTTKKGARRGIGLSRVYGFARQSGGRIELDSEPGVGTRVMLVLPRLRRRSAEERAAAPLQALQILLVEDEALISMLAEDLLGQLGCRVVGSASTLGEALAIATQADIDLALLDVNLRGEPAYPVAEALQARGVPLVFMSAYGDVEAPWRSRPMVPKPIELERLKGAIQRALERASS